MKQKAQAETPFILGTMVFLAFIIVIGGLIVTRYPDAKIVSNTDFAFMGGSFLLVAGACAISTGLACAGAMAFFGVAGFVVVQNTILYSLIFLPISITMAYVIARLGAHGG